MELKINLQLKQSTPFLSHYIKDDGYRPFSIEIHY